MCPHRVVTLAWGGCVSCWDGWLTGAFARCCSPSQGQIGQASLEKSEVNVRMGELQIVLKIGNGESDA